MTKKERKGIRMTPAALDFLCGRYPKCFNLANPQPLKIGITKDVLAELPVEISRNAIENAIHSYATRPEYLAAVTTGRSRINLQGDVTSTVEPYEEAYARARFELAQPPPGTKPPTPPPAPLAKPSKLTLPAKRKGEAK